MSCMLRYDALRCYAGLGHGNQALGSINAPEPSMLQLVRLDPKIQIRMLMLFIVLCLSLYPVASTHATNSLGPLYLHHLAFGRPRLVYGASSRGLGIDSALLV